MAMHCRRRSYLVWMVVPKYLQCLTWLLLFVIEKPPHSVTSLVRFATVAAAEKRIRKTDKRMGRHAVSVSEPVTTMQLAVWKSISVQLIIFIWYLASCQEVVASLVKLYTSMSPNQHHNLSLLLLNYPGSYLQSCWFQGTSPSRS